MLEQKLKHALPDAAQTAATVAISTIIYMAPRAINTASYFLYCYNDKDLKKIAAIRDAYEKCCYSLEKDTSYSTLEKPGSSKTPGIDRYPLFFIMDEEKPKLPKLYLDGFWPNTDSEKWEGMMGDTPISTEIQDLIAYVCEYQMTRDKNISVMEMGTAFNMVMETLNREAPYFYDPINLFCEEFKTWLKNLGQSPLCDKTKDHIRARIDYLDKIYLNNQVFSQDYSSAPFLSVALYLKNTLENEIFTYLEIALSKKSAREYFHDLNRLNKALMRKLVGFLFYVFKDSQHVPENFSIKQISKPTLEIYKISLNNIAGYILQHLVNCSSFAEANVIKDSGQVVNYDALANTYQFFTDVDLPQLPPIPLLVSNTLDSDNWYKKSLTSSSKEMGEKSAKLPSGIVEEFKTPELMRVFLLLHGQIEKLSVFHLISQALYDLAGDIGNLTLYGCAVQHTLKIFADFESLIREIEKNVHFLTKPSDSLYTDITNNKIKKTTNLSQWAKVSYRVAKEHHKEIKRHLEALSKSVDNITLLIKKVNHPEYPNKIKQKIAYLFKYMELFTSCNQKNNSNSKDKLTIEMKQSTTLKGEIEKSPIYKIGFFEHKLALIPTLDAKTIALIQEADKFYQAENYESAFDRYVFLVHQQQYNSTLQAKQIYCVFKIGGYEFGETCLSDLENILMKDPTNETVIFTIASMLYDLDHIELSMEKLNKLFNLNPNHAEGKILLHNLMSKKSALLETDHTSLRFQ